MAEADLLRIRGLTYRYAGAAEPALDRVDLEVGEGEFLLLAGPSASGKTSLLRAAAGLIPHFHGGQLQGEVNVAGIDLVAEGPGRAAEVVGYMAQDPESQVLSTRVEAEIALPLEFRGIPEAARARAVEEVALALAIPHLLERTVDTLSGGELQRVALAASLVTRPKLILLDEPTSQLDPVAGDELIWLLRRLNAEWGVTVILAEHRHERCLAAVDRVVAFERGRVGFDGGPGDFLTWAAEAAPVHLTPGARLFAAAGITPPPTGVREARLALARRGLGGVLGQGTDGVATLRELSPAAGGDIGPDDPASLGDPRGRRVRGQAPLLQARDLWLDYNLGGEIRQVLCGIDLCLEAGERVALMGRNGAGKSSLLRVLAGLIEPARGRVEVDGEIALMTQNPGDFLVRERVGEELPGEAGRQALARVGLEGLAEADPRDLSGGQRQRLALAICLAGRADRGSLPGVIALDEPTRGLDRFRKDDLIELVRGFAEAGSAVVVATHDVEFAARFATRVVLLGGRGRIIADGEPAEILGGGWYFTTEVSRILDQPGLITPEQGAAWLAQAMEIRS